MDEHYSCPICAQPLSWDDAAEDWRHQSPAVTLACLKQALPAPFREAQEAVERFRRTGRFSADGSAPDA
jgi:hypothetical protein